MRDQQAYLRGLFNYKNVCLAVHGMIYYFDIPERDLSHFNTLKFVSYRENWWVQFL